MFHTTRLEDLRDYDQPLSTSNVKSPILSAGASALPTAQPAPADDGEETVTMQDMFQAILEAAQERATADEQTALNAALQQRIRAQQQVDLEQNYRVFLQQLVIEKQRQERAENLNAVAQLLMLQGYVEELERQKKQQQQEKDTMEFLQRLKLYGALRQL